MLRSKALVFGSEANKKAEAGLYYSAIELFSKAIELFPFDYRFYLNRAFCYEKTELYHLCLNDAEEAIRLNSSIEKCYFRKARALEGLKEWIKSEDTYRQLLKMSPNCREAMDGYSKLKCMALMEMGFDYESALRGAYNYETIRSAIDGLLSEGVVTIATDKVKTELEKTVKSFDRTDLKNCFDLNTLDTNSGRVCYEPGVKYADKARTWAQLAETQMIAVPPVKQELIDRSMVLRSGDKLLKPTNIWNYNGLRVENVNIDNKKSLLKRFSAFGKVKGIEPVRNSKSAVWVYFDNPESPIEAIAKLQGTSNTDLNYYQNGQSLPLRLYFAPTNDQTELKFCRPKQPLDNKGECYYWRTTNCSLEDKCSLLHIPVNKHIDAQVWMKSKDGKNN